MTLRFLSPAKRELAEAARYYESQLTGLGADFLTAVEQVCQKIRNNPEAWALVSDTMRRCRLSRFPYGVIYEIRGAEVVIASVMHLHRRPEHWKKNL